MAFMQKTFGGFQLFNKCLRKSVDVVCVRNHGRQNPPPRKRLPEWLPRPTRVQHEEFLTPENKEFLSELASTTQWVQNSPLKSDIISPCEEWDRHSRRTGLIGKKIGVYPMWLKNGKRVLTSLIQIVDNEVVKYIPPEEYNPVICSKHKVIKRTKGCLVVGAVNIDPQLITKEYFGIFNAVGVTPKRILMRFTVTPNAALAPATPLTAAHFKPGEFLDIRGKTVDRGFQGVMKRWGFAGMPRSHGVTKTHRRPGNIGAGGQRARVMPGTKMPGHMGNRWRILKGVKILRVNTKYNVIWVMAQNVPGETNTYCYLYDSVLPKNSTKTRHFPTYIPKGTDEAPVDLYDDDVHPFSNPSLKFESDS